MINKIKNIKTKLIVLIIPFLYAFPAFADDAADRQNIKALTADKINGFQTGLNWFIGADLAVGVIIAGIIYAIIGARMSKGVQSGNQREVSEQSGALTKLFVNTLIVFASGAILGMLAKAFIWQIAK